MRSNTGFNFPSFSTLEALAGRNRDKLQISVKFGALRDPNKGFLGYDSRPAAIRNFVAYSLQRLGVDTIDIYRPARLDPDVPIEESVGAMADMLPTKLIAELSALIGAPFLNSFGSTETGLAPASATLIPPGVVPASLSKRQSAMCDVRLVDSDNNEVADGEPGEVAIRGPTVFSGYWNAPESNARDFSGGREPHGLRPKA